MLLNGARISFVFVSLFLLHSIYAVPDDFAQYLPDMSPEMDTSLSEEEKKQTNAFIPGQPNDFIGNLPKEEKEEESFLFSDEGHKELVEPGTERESLSATGYTLPGTYDHRETIIQPVDSDIYSRIKDEGTENYSFVYLYDTYVIDDRNNSFTKTYESGPDTFRSGFFHLTYDDFLWGSGSFKAGYNLGLGVGYYQGYGVFASNSRSSTRFKLFMVPIDLGLAISAFRSNYLSLNLAGGASVMAVNQNRDDRDREDSDKDIRQLSPGFYGSAKLKLSINALYPSLSFEMFKAYNVTNSYVTLDLRYHNYSSFADQFTVSGASFGLGLSFDYY